MQIKKIFILASFCYSVSGISAFNDNESKQLSEIDMKSKNAVTDIVKKLDMAVNDQVSNNPEKKEQILALRVAWDVTTQKKCQLETFESKGTDSEISATNSCLLNGYKMEIDYFNNMLP